MQKPNEHQKAMLQERRIASVATISPDGFPHLTSVWFLYQHEEIFLAIPSSSAKGRNLSRDSRIAVMIDVRENYREAGLTACGNAEIISGDVAAGIANRIHQKYLTKEGLEDPSVGPVFTAIDDIVVRVKPTKWISWDMAELDKQVFDGKLLASKYFREIDR